MEIERKFLVRSLPEQLEQFDNQEIKQWYISKNPEIRLRQVGTKYWLTLKSKGGLMRLEHEVPLNKKAFTKLLPSTTTEGIYKTRYRIPLENGLIAELDTFHSKEHASLITVEVEFSSEAAAHAFTAPRWFGKDVTEDYSYKNRNLAANLPEKIRNNLVDYYRRIDRLFSRNYIATFRQFDIDVIHKLRISIKKQRAFLNLFSTLTETINAKKAYRPIRQVFRKAGAIRDLQVQQKLLRHYEKKFLLDLSEHTDRLSTDEQTAKKIFFTLKKQGYFAVLKKHSDQLLRSIRSLELDQLNKRIKQYFHQLFEEIFQLIDLPNKEVEQLHQLRKLLKELNYNLLLINDSKGVVIANKSNLKDLDALQELLGDWHDVEVAFLQLDSFQAQLQGNVAFETLQEELEKSYADYILQIDEALAEFKEVALVIVTKI